ncbi:hypothetical protein QBC46DRAFT_429770 [Diplogelasinospora grovesii]|uniref:Uncharacterized protein n=1 Tax=Diplogelasinospora grovesii TaxID=303347 RepID=A0AAN6MV85_9PEZI|nr:hypothetical protein QBC46DRAFT_429770 [Diplogelasinospora grovesii]
MKASIPVLVGLIVLVSSLPVFPTHRDTPIERVIFRLFKDNTGPADEPLAEAFVPIDGELIPLESNGIAVGFFEVELDEGTDVLGNFECCIALRNENGTTIGFSVTFVALNDDNPKQAGLISTQPLSSLSVTSDEPLFGSSTVLLRRQDALTLGVNFHEYTSNNNYKYLSSQICFRTPKQPSPFKADMPVVMQCPLSLSMIRGPKMSVQA